MNTTHVLSQIRSRVLIFVCIHLNVNEGRGQETRKRPMRGKEKAFKEKGKMERMKEHIQYGSEHW